MDRRKNRRIMVDLPIGYSENQQARAINISISGLKIEAKRLLTQGTLLFIVLHLPEEDLDVIGEVRWYKACPIGKFENGIELFFVDSEYKKKIKKFIENQADQHDLVIADHN